MNQNRLTLLTKPIYIPGTPENRHGLSMGVASGMNSKTLGVLEAMPSIGMTGSPSSPCSIMIIEPLSLSSRDDPDALSKNIEALSDNPAMKVVWAEEQEFLRWPGNQREGLLKIVKAFASCNKYQERLTNPFIGDLPGSILRTPVNSSLFTPATKSLKIVAMGRVCTEKNIAGVVRLFDEIPDEFEKVYIGGQGMWGEASSAANTRLETAIESSVDRWIKIATRDQVAQELSTAWGYFNVSIYDVGCLSFLEAAMSGCHCFAWEFHPMFDEYKRVHRFKDYQGGAKRIVDVVNKAGVNPDMKMRAEVMRSHSYESFASQIESLVMGVIFDV